MRRRRLTFLSTLAFVFLVPQIAYAIVNLYTAGGLLYDVYDTYGGYLLDGGGDAYDGCYQLYVGGTTFSSTTATTSMGGRQVDLAEVTMGSLRVRRFVYVPMTGGEYARFLDVISNPGATDVMTTVRIYCNLGSDGSEVITGTSSGDTVITNADNWVGTDDTEGSGDPSLGHVIHGDGAAVRAAITKTSGAIEWTFNVTVPAGGRVAFLTFALQARMRAPVHAEAARVVDLPSDVLTGIETYVGDIVNFNVGGAPLIDIAGPDTVDEGSAIRLDLTVTDREGDPTTFSWDLDGDGMFGELAGAITYSIPAGMTDGASELRIGVRASDGTNTRERYKTITVNNVPPTITSEPPLTMLYVGSTYRYPLAVDEPAGVRDPLTYRVVTGPMGMAIGSSGELVWMPTSAHRDMTFGVTIEVADGDGGTDMQMWSLSVSNNRPPEPPTPFAPIDRMLTTLIQPTLVVDNGSDLDGDALSYFFVLDRVSTFDSPARIESPEVREMVTQTSWRVPVALEDGVWYWQVWAYDGVAESTRRNASFVVDADATPDAGMGGSDAGPRPDSGFVIGGDPMPRRRSSGCCAVAPGAGPSPTNGAGAALVALGLLAAWHVRRRRR